LPLSQRYMADSTDGRPPSSEVFIDRHTNRPIRAHQEARAEESRVSTASPESPRQPQVASRLEEINRLFDEEGIPVAWRDESIEGREN